MSLPINPIGSIDLQMGRPQKVPYYQVVVLVLEVVDTVVSSSTLMDYHKKSFAAQVVSPFHCELN